MTHKEARALANHIKGIAGWACWVPNGYGPDRYVARIGTVCDDEGVVQWDQPTHDKDFSSQGEFDSWWAKCETQRRRQIILSRPRSPIDILIDRACGLE